MPDITLAAATGRPTGSAASRRMRAEGKIPAVLYGHGIDPVPIAVDGRELRAALNTEAGVNALLNLELEGGDSHLALARVLQRDPVRHVVTHIDFQVVRRDEIISADVPVTLVGEAEAVTREGGVVDQNQFNLTINATPGNIPTVIEVDISELAIGDTIRVGDLRLPEGVTTDVDSEEPVVVGQPPQAEIEEPEEELSEIAALVADAAAGEEGTAGAPDTAAGEGEAGEGAEAEAEGEG